MANEFLPYGSSRYAGLVTKQGCANKFVAPRLPAADEGESTGKEGRLVRRNARRG